MSVQAAGFRLLHGRASRPYAEASLVELIERIVEAGDKIALRELHDERTPFRIGGQPAPLTLTAFVTALCGTPWARRMCGSDQAVAERAFELTIERFSALPSDKDGPHGTDCRLYFASVLAAVRAWASRQGSVSGLDLEAFTARMLQRRVASHTWLCCQEARRCANPMRSRFAWPVNGTVMQVWMPMSLAGGERRRWLDVHVPDVDPRRPGERARVQAIVDNHLGVARVVSLPAGLEAPPRQLFETGSAEGPLELDRFVAEEKASRIHEQRAAIRALGPDRLKALILRIFQAIRDQEYDQKRVAEEFALSGSTLTRFAGIRWQGTRRVPDLWVNTARTLAGHEPLVEAALACGVWDRVDAVLQGHRHARPGDQADE